jgi:hypothetical protein
MSMDVEINEGMLYDWDRVLRPGGYVVLTSEISRYLTSNNDKVPDRRPISLPLPFGWLTHT